ncbi:MAG TPA: hypothetical protein VF850_06080 [Gemmatimonadaceae bacterium]
MTTTIWSASLTMQAPATAKPATTQNPSPAAKQDVQAGTRDFGQEISNNVQQQINAALSRAAAAQDAAAAARRAAATTQEPVLAPAPPTPPGRTITFRGRDGTETITLPPHAFDNTIPQQAVDISIGFFLTIAIIIIGLPLARAFARRMDRRGGTAQVSNEVSSQLAHLNQAVDAIALEVERISEGQRFTTRLLSEQRDAARQTLPSGLSR